MENVHLSLTTIDSVIGILEVARETIRYCQEAVICTLVIYHLWHFPIDHCF